MARLGGYCATCGKASGRNHLSTETHRKAVARAEHIPNVCGDDELAALRSARLARIGPTATDAENAAALRRLNGEPPLWVDEAPPVDDDPDYREPSRPARSIRPAPCHRCGRADFRTEKGRTWHVTNVPHCTAYIRPERHEYATMGA